MRYDLYSLISTNLNQHLNKFRKICYNVKVSPYWESAPKTFNQSYPYPLIKQMFSITDLCNVYFEVLFTFEEFSTLFEEEIVIHIYKALHGKYRVPFEPLGLL